MSTSAPAPTEFMWETQPQAAAFVGEVLQSFIEKNSYVRQMQHRLLHETGTRLLDWIAHIMLPAEDRTTKRLVEVGYTSPSKDQWVHPAGLFPDVLLSTSGKRRLFLMAESVADVVLTQRLMGNVEIEGEPLSAVRRVKLPGESDYEFWAIERHGVRDVEPNRNPHKLVHAILHHQEQFRLRKRDFPDEVAGFDHAHELIARAVAELGVDRACDLFFAAEREYWQIRNRAARIQKARQDALGFGWANHDHHTYRSSREYFAPLIHLLEDLGFECRERFYAGREAGWGAQVLEQPNAGVVIFADVDLSPEEVAGDFAHDPLPARSQLGTVGLWCKLHGEAFLQAGMHHLECRFDFDAAREQLAKLGVDSMKPFTDFPFLRQAFTKGEFWPVDAKRIEALTRDGRITAEQAEKFSTAGSLGSHLEILQRDDGYKGFNQTGINEIILKTDPRN